jgi:PAS domain S-box-containing protein
MPSLDSPGFKFIEILSDAAILVKESGEIVLANTPAEALFDYSRGELIGQSVQVLVPEGARDHHPTHVERYFANPHVRNMGSGLKLSARRRDGSEFPTDILLSPIVEDGELFTVVIIRVVDSNQERQTSPMDSH